MAWCLGCNSPYLYCNYSHPLLGFFFQPLELFAYDLLIKMRTSLPQDDRIVIVGIGEEDVEKIGSAIISDEIYANVIQNLLKQQPIAIGLDIYRDVPIPPGTDKLSQLFRENQNIVGIEKMVGDTRQYRVKPNPILKEKKNRLVLMMSF